MHGFDILLVGMIELFKSLKERGDKTIFVRLNFNV